MEAKFSNRVKEVISLSREEALRLGHDYIGTEHLVLGMVREGKIGGADRQVVVSGFATTDRFASAAARMQHKEASFEGVYALVEQGGRWGLLQEAVMMKTGAAR